MAFLINGKMNVRFLSNQNSYIPQNYEKTNLQLDHFSSLYQTGCYKDFKSAVQQAEKRSNLLKFVFPFLKIRRKECHCCVLHVLLQKHEFLCLDINF